MRAILLASLSVSIAGAMPFGDHLATGKVADLVEGRGEGVRIEGGVLFVDRTQAVLRNVPVTAGTAYRLSFEASFRGDVESIEDNPRFDRFTLPGERSAVLPVREIQFLGAAGELVGRSLVRCMPFRNERLYTDVFHAPAGAAALRVKIASGTGVTLALRHLQLVQVGSATCLNLNSRFQLGLYNYSGWQNIAAGGKLIAHAGGTVFDTRYGSRGADFPLAGPGTYALSAKAVGNGYNSTVHLDVFGVDGKKLMRASLRRFGDTNYFVVPAGATSGSLLVYSCLLEEVCVKRVGDEGAITGFLNQ